jgi:hypothetical protein
VNGRAAVSLILATCLHAQAPIENNGKPMRIPFECTEADSEAGGLNCSDEHPCPVYLELANVEAVGDKVFVAGNLHTPDATLYSILLASDDSGKTWTEPAPRMRSSGLDQIQFFDFENGWISGANLQSAPRDPFLLITTDGGKSWRPRPIFEESRVASIERFWFESRKLGTLLIDARLDNQRHELYETRTGGESWEMRQSSADAVRFPHTFDPAAWRLRADAATHSNVVEKSLGDRWRAMASFLVDEGACKQ